MTAIDLPIDQDEWVRVEKAVSATDLDDLVNPPVLVHPHPGAADRPHWRIRGRDGTLVEIRHDLPPTRPFKVALPARIIDHGALLATREGSCTLTIDTSGYAHVTGQGGSGAVLDLPPAPTGIDLPSAMQPSASATTTARHLADAIYSGTRLPKGVGPDATSPPLEVGIEDGTIGFGVDWQILGRPRCTYRTPADTRGTAVVGFRFGTVRNLIFQAAERDQTIDVSVRDAWVCFEAEDWKAWANQVETSAARWMPKLIEDLEEAGFEVEALGDSSLQVDGQWPIRVEAVDGEPEVLRISTVLATRLSVDADLRQELDNIMASRIGLRLWFEGTRLIAAEDLLCEWASALPDVLRRFSDQLMGLDVLLASSAGEQDNLFDPGEPENGEADGNPMPHGGESGWEVAGEDSGGPDES